MNPLRRQSIGVLGAVLLVLTCTSASLGFSPIDDLGRGCQVTAHGHGDGYPSFEMYDYAGGYPRVGPSVGRRRGSLALGIGDRRSELRCTLTASPTRCW